MPTSVAARLLAVLGTFTERTRVQTLSEISRRAGLSLTTTHRLVGELTRGGALDRDAEGRYRIGLWLWELATLAPHTVGLRESALPFLEDVYEATRHHAQLAVLDGHDAVFLERIHGRGAVHTFTRVGGRLPLHATGVGLVLLAHAEPRLQEEVITGPLRRFTEKTIRSGSRLRQVLAGVRRDGFVISDRQIEMITVSVAAPVYGPRDTVVAALSTVVPYGELDPMTLVPVVRAAARGISRALGAPSASGTPPTAARTSAPDDQPARPERSASEIDTAPSAPTAAKA
ncbi:IclR family transcriptional regulator [Amycolatopsis suaedae]|uniref:IclR family transcriptional regulator n=1 Tax=Amycolatopsis suaedae TaxID=2510978 RepID=A0A4Q7JA98_9PSEU|nr:IclR family transcriptional regulator [Amycolatopsis suaedae]RZQ63886.1 IclR family transcriptional regulator [Amycolatopsis suaedae]